MGGVDVFDQMMQYYNFARKACKWTLKFVMYLLQTGVHNAYTLFQKFHPQGHKTHLLDFMDAVSEHLVYFEPDQWPSTGPPIARAADLPLDEREDVLPQRPHDSDEDVDDPDVAPPPDVAAAATAVPGAATAVPAAAPSSPLPGPSSSSPAPPSRPRTVPSPSLSPLSLLAAVAVPPTPSPPSRTDPGAAATAATVTPRAAAAVPRPPFKRHKPDPDCRLRPGEHVKMLIKDHPESSGIRQKRCRVCWANGRRKDTQFMCALCCIPLCAHMRDCFAVYHNTARYWKASPRDTPQPSPLQ